MVSLSIGILWVHGFWVYYRGYTQSAIHAASVAALTIFGLLIFIDPLFAVLAIAAYICPPVVLYAFGIDLGTGLRQSQPTTDETSADPYVAGDPAVDPEGVNEDSNGDWGDGDTNSDTDGVDTDSDG